jgi:TraY domain
MATRGPAPRGEYAGKSQVLSTRIRPDTRAKLTASKKRSGRSLSQEIEFRLRRTFQHDDRAADMFGSLRNFRLMQMVGIAMATAYNPDQPGADWLDDPVTFDIAVQTMLDLLIGLRPPGDKPASLMQGSAVIDTEAWTRAVAMNHAARVLKSVQEADPSLPLNASRREHLAALIKVDLGAVVDRPTIVKGTAEDHRKQAAELEKIEKRSAKQERHKK